MMINAMANKDMLMKKGRLMRLLSLRPSPQMAPSLPVMLNRRAPSMTSTGGLSGGGRSRPVQSRFSGPRRSTDQPFVHWSAAQSSKTTASNSRIS